MRIVWSGRRGLDQPQNNRNKDEKKGTPRILVLFFFSNFQLKTGHVWIRFILFFARSENYLWMIIFDFNLIKMRLGLTLLTNKPNKKNKKICVRKIKNKIHNDAYCLDVFKTIRMKDKKQKMNKTKTST